MNIIQNQNIYNYIILSTPRPSWVNKNYQTTKLINDVEFEWSNGIYGMMYVNSPVFNTKYYTFSGNNRKNLILTPISNNGNIIDQNIIEKPMLNRCANINGSRYGQGTELKGYGNTNFLVPIICGNNTYINVRTQDRMGSALSSVLTNKTINWIASDPITGFIFVPNSYRNLTSIDIYRFDYSTPLEPQMIYVTNCVLNSPIIECTAGCFSNNGILYLLDNNNSTSGFKAYSFGFNNRINRYELTLKRSYSITKPSANNIDIFGLRVSDSQDLVGITVDKNNNIFTLLRNTNSVNNDSITLWKTSGLF